MPSILNIQVQQIRWLYGGRLSGTGRAVALTRAAARVEIPDGVADDHAGPPGRPAEIGRWTQPVRVPDPGGAVRGTRTLAGDERPRHPDPGFAVAVVACDLPPGGRWVGAAALLRRGGTTHRSPPDHSRLAEAPAGRAGARTRGSSARGRRPDRPGARR